jgi:hypothetical protein
MWLREPALTTELPELAGNGDQRVGRRLVGKVIEFRLGELQPRARRPTSPRAIRTSISCSRASAASRAGPVPASIRSHPAESGSSRGMALGGCSTPDPPAP